MSQAPSVAIIGAGMSGLSAATRLHQAGLQVTLFDKSRGSGGRMSSKRTDLGTFDMGTQYFTARDPAFVAAVTQWRAAGWVAEWQPRLFRYDEQGLAASLDQQQRFVGSPRMTALSRGLLGNLPLHSSTRIEQLQRIDQQWLLRDSTDEQHGPFDRVMVAIPPAQALPLISDLTALAAPAARCEMEPGWAVALGFSASLGLPLDAVFVRQGPLDWIARDASKPGRGRAETWVLQSTPSWASAHLESEPHAVIDELLSAMQAVVGEPIPAPIFQHAHRWLYARPAALSDWGALAAPAQGVYICGDWCLGGRLEAAWLSGQHAAKALLDAT